MKTIDRDFQTYITIIDKFIGISSLDKEKAELIKSELKTYLNVRLKKNKWFPIDITKFSTDWYREFYRMVDGEDPYKAIKQKSNGLAQQIVANLSVDSFEEAIAAGIIGNNIDYGAEVHGKQYNLENIDKDIRMIKKLPLHVDETEIFKQKLQKAKKIVFLADNNGEAVFDKYLLDYLSKQVGKSNLYIFGKSGPMLNDVTIEDLEEIGVSQYGQIVSTGSNCFGLHKEEVSEECVRLLKEADLIVAKGQAYMEFFTEYNFTNVIHLLAVKYPIVGLAFGTLYQGYNIVMSSERYAHLGKNYFEQGGMG
jgi:uncharacterized protein with ATP-grasp and redox domains